MARVIIIAAASLSIVAACPPDLDAQLIARTGCGAHEVELLLDSGPDRVALALLPLLDGEMELGDLAAMVASDPGAVDAVRELYRTLPPFSVTDFGAVGDGVTDDTAAFHDAHAAAVALGTPVAVPPGDWVVQGNTFSDDPDPPSAVSVGDTPSDEAPE